MNTDTTIQDSLEQLIEGFFESERQIEYMDNLNKLHTMIVHWYDAFEQEDRETYNALGQQIKEVVKNITNFDDLCWIEKYTKEDSWVKKFIEKQKTKVLPDHLTKEFSIKKLLWIRKETTEGSDAQQLIDDHIIEKAKSRVAQEELELAPEGSAIEQALVTNLKGEMVEYNFFTLSLKWQYHTLPSSKLRKIVEEQIQELVTSIKPEQITPERIAEYRSKIEIEDSAQQQYREQLYNKVRSGLGSILTDPEVKNSLQNYFNTFIESQDLRDLPRSEYIEKDPTEEFIEYLLQNNRTSFCPPVIIAFRNKALEFKDHSDL